MSKNNKIIYPLLENAFSKEDLNCGIKVLKSKQITMSKKTINFEKTFAKKNGSKYAIMTNSGSSANLLALSALTNLLNKKRIKERSEVIIPAKLLTPTPALAKVYDLEGGQSIFSK